MFKFSLLVVAALVLGPQAVKGQIVGGENANIADFPHQVSLRYRNKHFCGGALIKRKHVLTAAHCIVVKVTYKCCLSVVTGTSDLKRGGKKYRIAKKYVHPYYNDALEEVWVHDIAVLELASEVELLNERSILNLPTAGVQVNSEAVVSGWGSVSYPSPNPSRFLQKMNVTILNQADCQSMIPNRIRIHRTYICTLPRNNTGICTGDSGGALIQNGFVIGIVVGSIDCAAGYPDIFIDVYRYLDYLRRILAD